MSESNSGSIHLEREVESHARWLNAWLLTFSAPREGRGLGALCSQHSILIQPISPRVGYQTYPLNCTRHFHSLETFRFYFLQRINIWSITWLEEEQLFPSRKGKVRLPFSSFCKDFFIYGCAVPSPFAPGLSPAVANGGLLFHRREQASGCCSFSCGGTDLDTWSSVVVVHGLQSPGWVAAVRRLRCPTACEIFLSQGWNPCPLHWQVDSQPLDQQGSPKLVLSSLPVCKFQRLLMLLLPCLLKIL